MNKTKTNEYLVWSVDHVWSVRSGSESTQKASAADFWSAGDIQITEYFMWHHHDTLQKLSFSAPRSTPPDPGYCLNPEPSRILSGYWTTIKSR